MCWMTPSKKAGLEEGCWSRRGPRVAAGRSGLEDWLRMHNGSLCGSINVCCAEGQARWQLPWDLQLRGRRLAWVRLMALWRERERVESIVTFFFLVLHDPVAKSVCFSCCPAFASDRVVVVLVV